MIHNLKFPDGTIKAVDCKLGTGIKDKDGRADENYLQSRPLYKLENPPSFDRNLLHPVPQRLEIIGHDDD